MNFFVGITALRTVNLTQLSSVAITDDQSWMFSRHCAGGKLSFRMANKLTDGGNGNVDKYGPTVRKNNMQLKQLKSILCCALYHYSTCDFNTLEYTLNEVGQDLGTNTLNFNSLYKSWENIRVESNQEN